MAVLRVLGGAFLEDEEGEVVTGPVARRHPLALLAILSATPSGTLSRSKLVGLLWPDSGEKAARNRLNTCVYRVRKALGEDVLLSAGTDLRLDRERLPSDVVEFERALREEEWRRAIERYGGQFLDGFRLGGSPEFEKWVDGERARLRRSYLEALETLAETAEERGEPETAVQWWRRRASEDPYDSRVTVRLMKALAASGNRAGALRVGRVHTRLVEEELGTAPGAEVEELAEELGSASEVGRPGAEGREEARSGESAVEEAEDGDEAGEGEEERRDRSAGTPRDAELPEVGRKAVGSGPAPLLRGRRAVATVLVGLGLLGGLIVGAWYLVGSGGDVRSRRPPPAGGPPPENAEAYRLYTQGRALLKQRTVPGMRQAAVHFRRAIRADSGYAAAWAGLADALALLGSAAGGESTERGADGEPSGPAPEAVQAAERALVLNPRLAEAHASLGLLHARRGEGPAAVRALRTAVRLRPRYAEAHHRLALVWLALGRPGRARERIERAAELDSLAPAIRVGRAAALLVAGGGETALAEARRAREIQPGYSAARVAEGMILYHLGRLEEARSALRPLSGPEPAALRALIRTAAGDAEGAREILGRLEESGANPFHSGLVHAALGDFEAAFQRFRRVEAWSDLTTARSFRYHFPEVLGELRRDPRYPEVLRALNRRWGLEPDGGLPGAPRQ